MGAIHKGEKKEQTWKSWEKWRNQRAERWNMTFKKRIKRKLSRREGCVSNSNKRFMRTNERLPFCESLAKESVLH